VPSQTRLSPLSRRMSAPWEISSRQSSALTLVVVEDEVDMKCLKRFFGRVEPLPPIRATSEILSDIDHQVGRLTAVRERATELIKQMETPDEQRV